MLKNKNIIFLIIPFLFLACSNNSENIKNNNVINFESGFSLYQDTIFVDIKGDMTHALKYNDKLYVLFKKRVLRYGGYGKRWLYVFSNGQVEKVVDCPPKMEAVYLDFYINNDSLILKPYMDEQSYYLDLENYNWIEIDKTDDLIFEDEMYKVYSLDFGEWGGKTWFKDKKIGQEYVIEATTPLVNKIETDYYFTFPYRILKIENPQLLNKCNEDITYENIETTSKYYSWYGEPTGFDVVYKDTTFDYFDYSYKPHIVSSFVLANELLHIYETDSATYIARHLNDSIETIQKIVDNIRFFNWHYSYRCVNLQGNNELLKFTTKNEQIFGVMELIDSAIHVYYFKNNALLEPKHIGAEKSDSIFINRLKTILPELNKLEFSKIDAKERTWGSFDITPNRTIGIGNSWNPNNYAIDTCSSYLIQEDSIFSNSIMYFGTKENGYIRVVSIDWDYERNLYNSNSEENAKKIFVNKTEFLIDYISNNIGKQTENNDEKNFVRRTWETQSGIILYLSYNKKYYGIRLVIYEK